MRPQDDLYRAVNGGWLRQVQIPADRVEVYGVDMPAVVNERLQHMVQELAASKAHRPGSVEQKIADYYRGYLDTAAIDAAGMAPVRRLMAEIDAIQSVRSLAAWQGRAQGLLQTPIWFWGGFADFMDPNLNRVMAWQGGLGLPDRDYYLQLEEPRFAQARSAYLAYLQRLAELAGDRDPARSAQTVLALETRLAAVHVPLSEAREPSKMANPLTPAELQARAPGFDWPAFFAAAQLSATDKVNVTQLGTAIATARLFAELPLADWKTYFRLRSLDAHAQVLPQAFRQAHFAFHGKALGGAKTERPRAQRALEQLSEALNDALAQQYVARYFTAAHKQGVQGIYEKVLAAYREVLSTHSGMAPATRAAALDKLDRYKAKIGHPEQWPEGPRWQVRAGDAFGNLQAARRAAWALKAAAAGKPMDPQAWAMSPLEVNAFYDPMGNEILLTAAILQAPLYDPAADEAANFGGIGAQIAHEISHGFDSMGAQFDGQGRLRNWWTEEDRKAFEGKAAQLKAQFNGLEALPGKTVNGELTLPENMADLMGLHIAFKAYQASLGGQPSALIDGLSGEQRFFMSYARSWRVKRSEQRSLQLLSADPHAPNEFRANVPAMNLDAFHEAFQTAPGDAMFKPVSSRIRLW